MKVITTVKDMQQIAGELRASGKEIGFVPTMGYLHEGHATLLRQAKKENDIVILSVFVNPLQFGPDEDFDRYPRDIKRDERVAKEAGVDYLFYPSVDEMYPAEQTTKIEVVKRTNVLCGKRRPVHFAGVATVLMKLFHITMPTRAYFGMKDAQQVAVVEGIVSDFHIPVTIVPVEIVREADGLAKSSRNVYLSEQERKEAPHLYRSLCIAKQKIEEGERHPRNITTVVKEYIEANTNGIVDYVDIYAYPALTPLEIIKGRIILAIAVQFKNARLIDNITLTVQ
ncbi:pantoate--beta-alanine ligase [Bacillus cytotoxicus]|uniref:Pantothenate synthetase n=3 Tax=Bacillus cereus group TaxID=86661 RepID=PANC_BACCN|nr:MULTISPECIES: pantoate--beta-alanine ligase [Bacillus cereus group]A7GN77.1 RecName: Full=Pantothenate synthetase; Short=PS; AltName: Full=Pantoate--beta-alanine ligase; AltName: Full=Pantoate-activating enzyme [Bacillus cytotoxicus NVH 391-98]ABS21585.1 pantoate--beta-alanine ligase [Bacillus cytotoxicus NVH 391-98]AWC32250.1 pantoate--beta-alanine ligase [Bacillus cytotoxicus]AWC36280.1 pantoate--beta-alanine ligase [Bacillus cytotoxicus]AWC44286.1 pantoate--beta-alanine ligase [Bacillus 